MKAIMSNNIYSFEYDVSSEDHGFVICQQAYRKMGLIGRFYINCGSLSTWIRE